MNAPQRASSFEEAGSRRQGTPSRISLLLVSAADVDHHSAREALKYSTWKLQDAFSCSDAIRQLQKRALPVVVCRDKLPDGDWRTVDGHCRTLVKPPRLIVASPVADNRLWGEVLHLGAFDLLGSPFDKWELIHSGFLAWRSWCNLRESHTAL